MMSSPVQHGSPQPSRQATAAAYRRVYDLAPDMFAIVDAKTACIIDCNRALIDTTGFAKDELVGRSVFDLYDIAGVERAKAVSRAFVRSGASFDSEVPVRRRDGGTVPVNVSVSVGSRDAEGRIAESILILHDMTRRKAAERALKISEARYQNLYHNAPDMFASLDPSSHRIVQCNKTLARVTGVDRTELIGRSLFAILATESHEAVRAALEQAGELGDVRNIHLRLVRGEGHPLEASMHVTAVTDERGFLFHRLVLRDITERKRAQEALRAAHHDLEQRVRDRTAELARSNTELEQFAYVASHDLQEPLRKIQAFGERLHKRAGSQVDAESRDYLARMLNAAQRMQALIADLLQLSRVMTRGEPLAPTNLDAVVREVVSDLDARVQDSGGRVMVDALPVVVADATQMRQLFQNLIGNGLKFCRPDAAPVVEVRALSALAGGTDTTVASCRISVSDNGIGLDEKYRERIFAPFQRLHSRTEYAGTGMGLAISRRIAERHGGTISVTSQPGQGATFVVTLPLQRPAEGAGG